jgi:hypothetical protein
LPESVIELGHWVHSNDDNFAFRVGTFHPYKVYLYPTQIDVDFVDVPDIADESPSLGLVATFAGGALGLGFSVTKLWS